jgi:guanylate kinase
MEALKQRLRTRAADDDETIERRFGNAKREIEEYGLFDYLIVNDDLEDAKMRLRSIVLAEQSRCKRKAIVAERLLGRVRAGA